MKKPTSIALAAAASACLILGSATASVATPLAASPSTQASAQQGVTLGQLQLSVTPKAAKKYKNCKALQKKYRHGVGMPGAKDKTSGKPVTKFKKSKALYKANKHLDRDKDRIACEKR